MPEFLQLLPPDQALEYFMANIPGLPIVAENVPVLEALGRVAAARVISPEALPAFNRSAVDGYAVKAKETYGASESLPVYFRLAGEIPMGMPATEALQPFDAWLIHTGGMLPQGADAVVMLEQTQSSRPGEIEVNRAAGPGENVILRGEDITVGDELFPAGRLIRPAEIGGLLALGITRLSVVKLPTVAIISSGDELVEPGNQLSPGQIRDINSFTLAGLVRSFGASPLTMGIVPDRLETMQATLTKCLEECDLVVITAGSSASARDFTAEAINRAGKPGVLVHGVNVKPGKPTILGVCNGKPVIGLPGNPVSALVIGTIFIKPVIERLLGIWNKLPGNVITARLKTSISSQAGRVDYVPVQVQNLQGEWVAEPVFYKSNLIFTLVRTDGLVCIPAPDNGLAAGAKVEVRLI